MASHRSLTSFPFNACPVVVSLPYRVGLGALFIDLVDSVLALCGYRQVVSSLGIVASWASLAVFWCGVTSSGFPKVLEPLLLHGIKQCRMYIILTHSLHVGSWKRWNRTISLRTEIIIWFPSLILAHILSLLPSPKEILFHQPTHVLSWKCPYDAECVFDTSILKSVSILLVFLGHQFIFASRRMLVHVCGTTKVPQFWVAWGIHRQQFLKSFHVEIKTGCSVVNIGCLLQGFAHKALVIVCVTQQSTYLNQKTKIHALWKAICLRSIGWWSF